MKIRVAELGKVLDYLRRHGDAQELDITVDNDLKSRVVIKASIHEDEAVFTIFEADLNVFPKITKTERL